MLEAFKVYLGVNFRLENNFNIISEHDLFFKLRKKHLTLCEERAIVILQRFARMIIKRN